MPIKPIGDKLLIEDIESKEKKSEGGLIVPDKAKQDQKTAKIISIGSGKCLQNGGYVPWDCKPDDIIIYNQFAGNEVEDENGKKFKLISQEDVWAVIKEG